MFTNHFDRVQKFTSNRQDWVNFGQYVQTATATAIQACGEAQYTAKMPNIQNGMEQVFQ